MSLPLSDYTNSEALLKRYRNDLMYCYPWGQWLVWDGARWTEDTSGQIMRLAKSTIKGLAHKVGDIEDDQKARAYLAHIKNSLATSKLEAMVRQARCEVPVEPEALDSHPWLLNCVNGTLDLTTGILRQHARNDLLTRSIPAAYDPEASCPTWDAFLTRILPHDTIAYVQRLVGYTLVGVSREKIFPVMYGSGDNGKTRFVEALRDTLGTTEQGGFATRLNVKSLMEQRFTGRASPDIAKLRGVRFAYANEGNQGDRLNEGLIKDLTGGDSLSASFLYQNEFNFTPSHTLWFATNHRPEIRGTDHAIWSRVKLIPFTVTIPKNEQDTALGDKLKAEASGILAWAVRGCLAWQQDGLHEPDAVQVATDSYRAEMDRIAPFLDECCILADYAKVRVKELYAAYVAWCDDGNVSPLTKPKFGEALREKGYETDTKTGNVSWWEGIGMAELGSYVSYPVSSKTPSREKKAQFCMKTANSPNYLTPDKNTEIAEITGVTQKPPHCAPDLGGNLVPETGILKCAVCGMEAHTRVNGKWTCQRCGRQAKGPAEIWSVA